MYIQMYIHKPIYKDRSRQRYIVKLCFHMCAPVERDWPQADLEDPQACYGYIHMNIYICIFIYI